MSRAKTAFFHCRRALYLAEAHGMHGIGFAAEDVKKSWRFRRYVREVLACGAAWLDVNLLDRRPHFEK